MPAAFHYILYESSIKVLWDYNLLSCRDSSGFKIFFTGINFQFWLLLDSSYEMINPIPCKINSSVFGTKS
jgi:hypothetical protein